VVIEVKAKNKNISRAISAIEILKRELEVEVESRIFEEKSLAEETTFDSFIAFTIPISEELKEKANSMLQKDQVKL